MWKCVNLICRPWCPTFQPTTSSVPFAIPTPHVALPPRKRRHAHGSRASWPPPHLTSGAYARILNCAHAGETQLAQCGPCCGLRKVMAQRTRKRTGLPSAPMMKMRKKMEAACHHCARRGNQTPRNNLSSCCLHRRTIARHGAGWREPGLVENRTPKPKDIFIALPDVIYQWPQ